MVIYRNTILQCSLLGFAFGFDAAIQVLFRRLPWHKKLYCFILIPCTGMSAGFLFGIAAPVMIGVSSVKFIYGTLRDHFQVNGSHRDV